MPVILSDLEELPLPQMLNSYIKKKEDVLHKEDRSQKQK